MRATLPFASCLFWCVACAAPKAPESPPEPVDRGAVLFAHHCAVCHGADGDADTLVATLLLPRPNPFRQGLFKLASTTNGMPTDDDLVATLRRGMPGSTMMGWDWLPEDDLLALARHVRQLAVNGRADSIHQTAAIGGRPLALEQALAIAERELLPGPTVAVGAPAEPTEGTLAEGERLFARHCAACHGADGRGLPQTRDLPTDGTWLWPRDFTAGYLRGDATHRDLAYRILAGMPGAHMPPTRLSAAETEALVAFVRSLIPEQAEARHVQWRRTIRVERRASLPDVAADWPGVEAVRLPTTPLRWRPDACSELWLRATHDGTDLLLRLEWADPTRDVRALPGRVLGDGVAAQFTTSREPPLLPMGTAAEPVDVWRWHAFDPKETAGLTDLLQQPPHQGLDVPVSLQPRPRSESLQLRGVGSAAALAGSGRPLQAEARHRDGRWTVTFRRALAPRGDGDTDLLAETLVLVAFAVWDGSADDHAGSKSITTWHALEIAR